MNEITPETLAEWRKDAEYWRECLPTKTDKLQGDRVLALLAEVDALFVRAERAERARDEAERAATEAERDAGVMLARAETAEAQATKIADGLHIWREQCVEAEAERDEARANLAASMEAHAVTAGEVARLREGIADVVERCARAEETLRAMQADAEREPIGWEATRLAGKREGVGLARDYLRALLGGGQ